MIIGGAHTVKLKYKNFQVNPNNVCGFCNVKFKGVHRGSIPMQVPDGCTLNCNSSPEGVDTPVCTCSF